MRGLMYKNKQRQRILVVDDEAPIRRVILRQLGSLDVELYEAKDAKQALELMELVRPHLILLDIKMPGQDGYEVCRLVRADRNNRFAKIILLSSLNELSQRLKGYEVGADLYWLKPFENEELVAIVKSYLRLSHTEEVDQLKSNLLQLIAHESRNPLNGILGFAEFLTSDAIKDPQVNEIGGIIMQQGRMMLNQIQKADLFCRLVNGEYSPVYSQESLGQVISELLDQDSLSQKNITLEVDPTLRMKADWFLLKQVLGFVIENAVEYSPKGSPVTVSVSSESQHLLIKVADQGKGLSLEQQRELFEALWIEDILHHQKGQGLSLAMSKWIVDLHQGKMKLESNQPQGTVVTINLPCPNTEPVDLQSLGFITE